MNDANFLQPDPTDKTQSRLIDRRDGSVSPSRDTQYRFIATPEQNIARAEALATIKENNRKYSAWKRMMSLAGRLIAADIPAVSFGTSPVNLAFPQEYREAADLPLDEPKHNVPRDGDGILDFSGNWYGRPPVQVIARRTR
jgi:hypothetical protein